MKEEWRTVPNWDLYEISNYGRLRSKDRTVRGNKGQYLKKGRLLKPVKDKDGYYTFLLKQDGKSKNMKIHRIVAFAFIPNPDKKPCINHIDNNPSNNRVDNLEWCTMREPTYKAVKGTNIKTGEIIIFNSLNSVKEKGFQPSCVCLCCKHKRGVKQHKGYRWEYIDAKHN